MPRPPEDPATADPPGRRLEFRFLGELKRRNVGRVAVLYLIGAWLILQPVNVVFDMLDAPAWANRLVLILLALGLPAALIFAWVFELTPDGIKPAAEVEPRESIRSQTGQRLNRAIIAVMGLALAYFIADKFWLPKEVTGPSSATSAVSRVPATATPAAAVSDKSIAVLPFVDMSEKKDQEYFSDGLSEELIDLIAKIPELRVPARTSSFYFKGKQTTIADIARALSVAHVLEGSVRKSGDTLRITAQLIRADDGFHIWSETYDRHLDDIFKIQDDIAGAVVDALKVSLLGGAPPHAVPTRNTEAYTLYLQGLAFGQRYTREDTEKAADYLRRSVEADPNFAPAWYALAGAYSASLGLFGTQTDWSVVHDAALHAARQAIALDPQLARAHVELAGLLWFVDFDFEGGRREIDRAMELDPNDPDVLASASLIALSMGHAEDSVQLARKAVAHDPLSVDRYRVLGMAEYFAGRLDEAAAVFRQVLETNPAVTGMHHRLGFVLIAQHEPEAALAEMEREPDDARRQLGLALAFDAVGRTTDADAALAVAEKDSGGWAYQIAQIYAHRGDTEQAFAWLDRAYANRDTGLPQYVKSDPLLENVRQDPRYAALLRKLNLPL
jgi:adenylate cyclase